MEPRQLWHTAACLLCAGKPVYHWYDEYCRPRLAMIDYACADDSASLRWNPALIRGFRNYQNAFANETFNALIDQIKVLNKEIAEDSSLVVDLQSDTATSVEERKQAARLIGCVLS